jgi:hypothetical protein
VEVFGFAGGAVTRAVISVVVCGEFPELFKSNEDAKATEGDASVCGTSDLDWRDE